MALNRKSTAGNSTHRVRAVHPLRAEYNHKGTPAQTAEPSTSVASALDLARARLDVAELFDTLLKTKWAEDAYSNRALATLHIGRNEKLIRDWRSGKRPMPIAALLLLPKAMAIDLVESVFGKHKSTKRTKEDR